MNVGITYAQRVLLICLIIGGQRESFYVDGNESECDFSILVNISRVTQWNNDGITVYDVQFSKGQYARVDYALVNGRKTAIQVCCLEYQCNKFCHLHEDDIELTLGLKVKCVLKTILNINMIASMPFIVVIIGVYFWLPELRNIHGKCLICYLIFLGCKNVITVFDKELIGEGLFHILNIFLVPCMIQWIHVITFDTWQNLKPFRLYENGKLHEGRRLCLYAFYVCSTPFVLLGITFSLQSFDNALNMFYAYFIILSIINVIFFLLIIWNIVHTNQELLVRGEDTRLLDRFIAEKRRLVMYFRIFIITGVIPSFAVFSKFLFKNDILSHGFDMFLSLEPVLLFILLVLKRSTIARISTRWKGTTNSRGPVMSHRNVTSASSSTKTGSSDV
ncbi:G-protein coupled receptor Mth2-like [Sitodiplosis mosellana]|uniref:G-protein coupled receptor Mth2-like n=1 Tax=Sitodiplosis mosellana TaxID=263140 RepID=UPI00244497DE|nr:G-protein coupled receptor Mth2-like [Sitodiplosis mosellana]